MGSTPSPPPVPDPYKTASAQGASDVQTAGAQTALANANTYTPYGQTTFEQTGTYTVTQPDGTVTTLPTYSSHSALSADGQTLLDQNNSLGIQANNIASQALTNIGGTLANPITQGQLSKLQLSAGATPALQNSYASGQVQTGYDPGGAITRGYDTGPALQTGYDSGGNILNGYASGGNIQGDVNLGMANANAPTTFGQTQNGVQYFQPGDFSAARDNSMNAVMQRLAPGMAARQEALSASLANQGTSQGSSAWLSAMLSNAQADNDLRLGAVQTGDAEQQALFGQQATANQLFNSAQNQDYGQQQGRGQFAQAGIAQNNAAIGQNNAATLDMGNFHNAAQSQGEQENAARAAFSNSAQAQRNGQNAAAAGFFNSTIGQQNQQNAGLAAFQNMAQAQANSQNAAGAGFFNSAIGQQAQQNAALSAFSNTAANQDYQNRLAGYAFDNQAAAQQLQQRMALQNQQINEVSALRSGGQVAQYQAPQYQSGTLDQTPISADVYQSAGLLNDQYKAQLQSSAQNTAAFGSVLGGLFGGLTKGIPSDRRLKSEVSRVATARNGLTIYRYRLAGAEGWHVGMMADEVALLHPEAVYTDPDDGFARVIYERAVA